MARFRFRLLVVTFSTALIVILIAQFSGRWVTSENVLSYYRENQGIGLVDVNRRLSGWLVVDETVSSGGRWSPDGRMLAYDARSEAGENTELFVIESDTGLLRNLSQSPEDDTLPLWSPDGRMLAYMTQEMSGTNYVQRRLVMRVVDMTSGAVLDKLTQAVGANVPQSWSPDGRMLAFIHQGNVQDTSNVQIWVIDTETGQRVPSLSQLEGSSFSPQWSPDGRWFLFSKLEGEGAAIFVTDSLTGTTRLLAEGTGTLPMWSPDSHRFAYTSLASGIGGARTVLYIADVESGRVDLLTQHQGSDGHLVWSPDGRSLVFQSDRDGQAKLYLLDMVSGDIRLLTPKSYYPNSDLVWSPDGRWLAFSSADTWHVEVYVMDMDDYSVSQLTDDGANFSARWKP